MTLRTADWTRFTPAERIAKLEVWREQRAQFGGGDDHLLAAVHQAEKNRETRRRRLREKFRGYRAKARAA